ncbi:uncharacterized protein LOC100889077 isoform X2 [Strongylocentrotus purpuratus]|uniref:Uncharacterized protein n=1 Tax=Strongylocentrotus purpuratus TaxID=7668 RepID=A0A7M7HET3_STRPU|nr:uncharacterized protein LOC100889077 isoform X2 [Strongylocentrotus purpuratus]
MVENDLHSPVVKNKVAQKDSLTMNIGPPSLNSAVETEGTGSVPSEEVQYECARQGVGAPVNDWKATKKAFDLIEDSKMCSTGDETVKVENDQPQEMKDEKSDENCTMPDDSSHDLCRNFELHLQDNKLLTLEIAMEKDGQCERDEYVDECSQERGAVEADIGRWHSSLFPQSTEYTSEMPMDDQNPEGERAEEPGRDGADESTEWNDEALQGSDSSSLDLTRECPAEDVVHLSSLEKSQRLCIPDKVDDSCLKMNFDPEQEERSLHEAGDDLKMKMPGSSGLETYQRGEELGMPEENLSGNSFDGVPTSDVHREVEEQLSTENRVESEEASALVPTRKPISRECSLQPNTALDVSQGPDSADTERGDLSLTSDGSESINEEATTPVFQESDLSMDSSLMGLSDALDLEFGSNSPIPIMMNDLNIRMGSIGNTDYAFNMKAEESINPSSMDTCDDVERDVNKDPNLSVDDHSIRLSRSASPFAEGNESAEVPTSDHIQGVFTFKEKEALAEDFNHPSSELPREGDEGRVEVIDQGETVVSEFDMLISHETHQGVDEGTRQETFLNDLVSDQDSGALAINAEEEPLSTSHPAEELTENDDALSLVCDAEELMRNLDDLLQDEGLQLSEQSQETDETLSVGESSKSTSTKDVIVTDAPRSRRSSYREPSPQRSRVRGEDRTPGESKQGYNVSVHSRNGNTRFVYKNQDSHRAVVERSPKRVTGPNRNWSANKPLSASERLALHQRLGAQNAANASPNLALHQLMRNGPAIQHSGLLQHQLQQQQQELQRQLQNQLPPALQLRLGLIKNNTGLQNTSDDIALICQRQQVMVEKILQLYQKQRESDDLMEKQRDIIRHYQRAFLIARKGGPLSMREAPQEGNLRPCTSPRPMSPSPSANSELDRQIGRKWPLSDHREERVYKEHPEAKRMKRYPGNLDMNDHSVDRFSGYPDEEHPQRHVEHRIMTSRGNPVMRSGPGSGSDFLEGRQPGNPRFQSEEQLLISIPTNHPEDEIYQERKCILQRSSPIFPGTRNHPNHPHPQCDDEAFQPIQDSRQEVRVCRPRALFLTRDVPREASPLTGAEEYGDFNLDARSPRELQRGFPHQGPCGHPGHTCQEKRTSPEISCQGRRTPSPLQSNWESCRITERDQRTGMIIDYYHTSSNKDHPQVGRQDTQETHEPPPFTDPGRQGCPSPLDEHPLASRVCFPDVSQGPCRGPMYPNRFNSQGVFRAPLRLPLVDNACRAGLRPPAVGVQGNWRAPMGPSLFSSRAPGRAPIHPSAVGRQGACRAPIHTSVVSRRGAYRAPMHSSGVSISHHLVAQNFEGVLSRIPHTPGPGLLESQMQSRVEYRQEHDFRMDGQFGARDIENGFDCC